MVNILEAKKRLYVHEGFRKKPYRCSKNKLTIGIGHNIEDNPFTPEELEIVGKDYITKGITEAMAFRILEIDIKKFISQLEKRISFYKNLDDERQYALLDMAFNMGIGNPKKGLLSFKNMLLSMATRNFDLAAKHCLDSKYGRELPTRAERIARTIRTGKFTWKDEEKVDEDLEECCKA